MKLRLPLALLVAWALACGGKDEETTTTPPPPEPTPEVTPPPTPPTPPVTPPPPDGTATTTPPTPTDPTATPPVTEEGPVEVKTEGETKVETRSIKTSVSVPVSQRRTIQDVAEAQLKRRATELGYTKVSNIQLGDSRCNDQNCTTSATGTASRTVTVPPTTPTTPP